MSYLIFIRMIFFVLTKLIVNFYSQLKKSKQILFRLFYLLGSNDLRQSAFVVFWMIISVLQTTIVSAGEIQNTNLFRTYVYSEPTHLDANKLKTTSSNHLLSQLHRNLLRLDKNGILQPELAEKCSQRKLKIICKLKNNLKWNTGREITAKDFLRAYEFVLTNPESLRPDLLFPILNAEEIFNKKKKISELGIRAEKNIITFELKKENSDFYYSLANIILAPRSEDAQLNSGPYEVTRWEKGKGIFLKPHDYYWKKKVRPSLEFKFINDDNIALNLYEKNQLDMVRRLPTIFIKQMRSRKDFIQYPLTRFDFIAFNQAMYKQSELRAAISLGLNYPELQKLLESKGTPGCSSLPGKYFEKNQTPCLKMDTTKAKLLLNSTKSIKVQLSYGYSVLGGDDQKRVAEWLQAELNKNLNLAIQPIGFEQKIYLQKALNNEFSLYHKGVPLEIPTCSEALKQSLIQEKWVFEGIAELLKTTNQIKQKKICTKVVSRLLNEHLIIPTGHYDYSTLIRPDYDFELNELNQLFF